MKSIVDMPGFVTVDNIGYLINDEELGDPYVPVWSTCLGSNAPWSGHRISGRRPSRVARVPDHSPVSGTSWARPTIRTRRLGWPKAPSSDRPWVIRSPTATSPTASTSNESERAAGHAGPDMHT